MEVAPIGVFTRLNNLPGKLDSLFNWVNLHWVCVWCLPFLPFSVKLFPVCQQKLSMPKRKL